MNLSYYLYITTLYYRHRLVYTLALKCIFYYYIITFAAVSERAHAVSAGTAFLVVGSLKASPACSTPVYIYLKLPRFSTLSSSAFNSLTLCATNFVPTSTCSAFYSDVCLYFSFQNISYFWKYLTFKLLFFLLIMGVYVEKCPLFWCKFFVLL